MIFIASVIAVLISSSFIRLMSLNDNFVVLAVGVIVSACVYMVEMKLLKAPVYVEAINVVKTKLFAKK